MCCQTCETIICGAAFMQEQLLRKKKMAFFIESPLMNVFRF